MNNNRRQEALRIRVAAAELAADRIHPTHISNGDEQKFRTTVEKKNKPSYLASFTKGLPHDINTGLICHPKDFKKFVKAIDSADPRDFVDTPLGPKSEKWESEKIKTLEKSGTKIKVRAWESQGGGQTYNLEGPDPQAVTMPPAPAIGSQELTAEMGEVYGQALLRDVPFTEIAKYSCNEKDTGSSKFPIVKDVLDKINDLDWFKSTMSCSLDDNEKSRKRGKLTGQNAFRGITPGDNIGPYISQFLLSGNRGVNGNDTINKHAKGLIAYGSIRINQRVRFATPKKDYMTQWKEWLDVQNGANVSGQESYMAKGKGVSGYRFITTPRDIATYVHYDALYEAYLNACLLMLGEGTPFDPDIPFQCEDRDDHQQGFAHFGSPHILSLVTEVATRALKAVRYQKFNVHRRLRPEALAARLAQHGCVMVKYF